MAVHAGAGSRAAVEVRLRIEGHHLPGRRCGPYDDVHVALQVGTNPADPVPADADAAVWETVLSLVDPSGGSPDVRGPAVQGRRGERFAYLTWGSTGRDGFAMFRRAKLPLDGVATLVADGQAPGEAPAPDATVQVTVRVDLTGDDGMPRCAGLRAPAVTWSRS